MVLHDKCSQVIHSRNPFSESEPKIDVVRSAAEWVGRIQQLLKLHLIPLADTPGVWVISMRELEAHGITGSMSRRGNCWDNAVMESFFSTVQSELGEHFDSHGTAERELFDYIEVFYNQKRRHSTLGQISPAAFERQAA